MLARRQRLEVRGLQVHHGGALLGGVVGLGKGLAVHLDTLEGAERRGGTEHQAVVAAGIVCGRLVGAVQLSGDAGGGGVVIVAAGGGGGCGLGRFGLTGSNRVAIDANILFGAVLYSDTGRNAGQFNIFTIRDFNGASGSRSLSNIGCTHSIDGFTVLIFNSSSGTVSLYVGCYISSEYTGKDRQLCRCADLDIACDNAASLHRYLGSFIRVKCNICKIAGNSCHYFGIFNSSFGRIFAIVGQRIIRALL